jgi:hypothetical protein
VVDRADWLVSMIAEFLDAPMPEAGAAGAAGEASAAAEAR